MIDLSVVTSAVIFGGLMGAIVWDLITWWLGLPTSSSHALVGGYAGAALAKAGSSALIVSGWTKTLIFIVFAPLDGDGVRHADLPRHHLAVPGLSPAARGRMVPTAAAPVGGAVQPGHGANDAQKTMGIIAGVAVHGRLPTADGFSIPFWVILSAHAAIALGTLSGGWRIVHTMGSKITKLQPFGGFAAETSGAITLFVATRLGIRISTTHTITGAIVGVGATRRLSAVRWGVAGRIVWAWILTIPASALIGALVYEAALVLVFGLV